MQGDVEGDFWPVDLDQFFVFFFSWGFDFVGPSGPRRPSQVVFESAEQGVGFDPRVGREVVLELLAFCQRLSDLFKVGVELN